MAKKGQIKHFAACAIAGMSALSAAAALSSCDISMEKEAGYTEGQLYAVEAEFSKIRIDAKGGIALSISYGGEFSVSYAESEQEMFTFSVEDETLVVVQRRTIGSLLDYKSKALNIVVPAANKIASLTADIEGQIDCTLQGEYGLLAFDVDGDMKGSFSGSADQLTIDCDGTLRFGSKRFAADTVRIDCDGVLKFEVTCNALLDVTCDGTYEGTYYGDCLLEKKGAGVGKITKGE